MTHIIKNRYYYIAISGLGILISLLLIFFTPLNLGIDMTGGSQSEYSYSGNIDLESIRLDISQKAENLVLENKQIINGVTAYKISGEDKISIITGFSSDNEEDIKDLKTQFRKTLLDTLQTINPSIQETSYTNIGKSFGKYIKDTAKITLLIAIIAIAIYITYAFSGVISGISVFSYSIIVIITLFHDVILATGLYVATSYFLPEFKIDTFFITALLTILGYSINDTIVVFDRIRANLALKTKGGKKLKKVIEKSIGETIKRSIYTSLTLLFVLFTIFFFGPESIKGFVLVMIFGTIVGTYSSIFIASPLLYEANKNKTLKHIDKKSKTEDDLMVV